MVLGCGGWCLIEVANTSNDTTSSNVCDSIGSTGNSSIEKERYHQHRNALVCTVGISRTSISNGDAINVNCVGQWCRTDRLSAVEN